MTIDRTTQWIGLDSGRREAFERAINVSNSGSVLLQTYINRVVQQVHNRELGATAVLPRRQGSGDAERINRRTPGSGAVWVADTGTTTEATGTYGQATFTYRTLTLNGRVTRKIQATGKSYGDVLAGEIIGCAGDFTETLETALVLGNNAGNAQQPDGLLTLIQATSSQIVLQTTTTGGAAFTLDKLDETIDAVKGAGNRNDLVIFASRKGRRVLNAALQAQQQFNDMVNIAGGFRVRTYDGIPLITSTGLTDALVSNGSKFSAFSGGALTGFIVVNLRYAVIGELTPMTVMPLARVSSQYEEFEMFADLALALESPLGGAVLCGVDPAA